MTSTPRSGTQYSIAAGGYAAEIASVGASLRTLRHDGRDLVLPFAADALRPHSQGALLAPWPNRVVGGVYAFGGHDYELALTEPQRHHAIHGFVSWLEFAPTSRADDGLTLESVIVPQKGYPWRVRVAATFRLSADGLTQTVRLENEGEDAAPFGLGAHPYLVAGPGELDTWTIEVPAQRVLEVTPDRLIPVALHDVTTYHPDRFDRRTPRVIGQTALDHAFTDVAWDAEGRAAVRATDPSGVGVEISWGSECPWVQLFTGDLPGGAATPGNRAGLAVEPMTCAPDAFNDARYPFDTGLRVLEPGAAFETSWRIAALAS